jgi:hypothetical protein
MERFTRNVIFQYSSIPTIHSARAAEIFLSNLKESFSALCSAAQKRNLVC